MIGAKGAHSAMIDHQLELDKSRMQVPLFMVYGWPQEYTAQQSTPAVEASARLAYCSDESIHGLWIGGDLDARIEFPCQPPAAASP